MGLFFCIIYFALILAYLAHFDDPSGVNGYFYLKQITSLGTGHFYYFKDYSLAFLLPALLDYFFNNALVAFRVAIAAVMSTFALCAYWTCKDILRESDKPGLFAVGIVGLGLACNYSFYEVGFSFLKNMTALVFVLLATKFTGQALDRWTLRPVALALLSASLAFCCHKSSLLFLTLLGLSVLIQVRSWRAAGLLAGAVVFLLAAFLAFFSQGGLYLSHLLGDLHWAPASFWIWSQGLRARGNLIYLNMVSGIVFSAVYLYARSTLQRRDRLLGDFLVLLNLMAWLPLSQPGEDQFTYRIMLVSTSLGLVLMLAMIARIRRASFALGLIAGLLTTQFALSRPLSALVPNYSRYAQDVLKLNQYVGEKDHLICHHGLEFYVDYLTGIRCQIFLSDDPEQKQFRLVYAPQAESWAGVRAYALPKQLMEVSPTYLLLREEDWQGLTRQLQLRNSWRNPWEHRPGYIYSPN